MVSTAAKPKKEVEAPTARVLLSEQQQRIAALVEQAKDDAPVVEDIQELFTRETMPVPKCFTKRWPERAYKWKAVENVFSDIAAAGGVWEIVARNNHSGVDDRLFGPDGGVTYKGQNILCFSRRGIMDLIEKENVRQFNLKTDDVMTQEQKFNTPSGKEAVVVHPDDTTSGGYNNVNLTGEDDYDFNAPS